MILQKPFCGRAHDPYHPLGENMIAIGFSTGQVAFLSSEYDVQGFRAVTLLRESGRATYAARLGRKPSGPFYSEKPHVSFLIPCPGT
jgi:hypothetical protein